MSELIGQAFAWIFGEVFMGWVFGGTLKLIHSVGVRIYSLFVGTRKTPVAELRLKYDSLALPWLIGFSIFGAVLYFGFMWIIFYT